MDYNFVFSIWTLRLIMCLRLIRALNLNSYNTFFFTASSINNDPPTEQVRAWQASSYRHCTTQHSIPFGTGARDRQVHTNTALPTTAFHSYLVSKWILIVVSLVELAKRCQSKFERWFTTFFVAISIHYMTRDSLETCAPYLT